MIRTNIMLTPQQHSLLKEQSRIRHTTLGELVRDAVDTAFFSDSVDHRRQVALAAFGEGFISLGKLAESLGLDIVSTRLYLREQGIYPAVQGHDETTADAANA